MLTPKGRKSFETYRKNMKQALEKLPGEEPASADK